MVSAELRTQIMALGAQCYKLELATKSPRNRFEKPVTRRLSTPGVYTAVGKACINDWRSGFAGVRVSYNNKFELTTTFFFFFLPPAISPAYKNAWQNQS